MLRLLLLIIALLLPSTSWATVAFVNAAQGGVFNNSAAGIATAAQNVTAGNALEVGCMAGGADMTSTAGVTDTAGNTFTRVDTASIQEGGSQKQVVMFRAANVTGNASDVITCDLGTGRTGYVAAISLQFSGVATSSELDTSDETTVAAGSPNANVVSNAFSTAQADEVAVFCGTVNANGDTFTAGSGYTIPTNGTDTDGIAACEYQIFSSIQSSVTATLTDSTGSRAWAAGLLVIKGAGSAAFNTYFRRRVQ